MSNIAKTIVDQIGGRAFTMMGAKNLLSSENGLQFRIGRNSKGVTCVRITLQPSDTYRVEFIKVGRGYKITTLADVSDVYVDGLHEVIESNTGLYLSL